MRRAHIDYTGQGKQLNQTSLRQHFTRIESTLFFFATWMCWCFSCFSSFASFFFFLWRLVYVLGGVGFLSLH